MGAITYFVSIYGMANDFVADDLPSVSFASSMNGITWIVSATSAKVFPVVCNVDKRVAPERAIRRKITYLKLFPIDIERIRHFSPFKGY
jgi:hypothetical protein